MKFYGVVGHNSGTNQILNDLYGRSRSLEVKGSKSFSVNNSIHNGRREL